MKEEKDRRSAERIAIAGAEVLFQQGKTLKILKRFTNPLPLKDINKSGVRFETDQYLGPGSLMELQIAVPGMKKIELKGHVVWIAKQVSSDRYDIGVQFVPFGNGHQYNTLASHAQLDQIVKGNYIN